MQNLTAGEMIKAYQTLIKCLKTRGFEPKMYILDNECSEEFRIGMNKNGIKFQLVPPNDHRRNVTEKAIQTLKDHFVAVLCGTYVKFPMQLGCRILSQAKHQLNLLRKSRVVPVISSFACLCGQHKYNANPFTPLGCAVMMHVMSSKKKT